MRDISTAAQYPLAIKRLKQAIAQAEEAGLLGEKILGTDFNFTLHIKEEQARLSAAGRDALMASIEGKRGMPRPVLVPCGKGDSGTSLQHQQR